MATVKVIEPPAKVIRFRYKREGRSGGLIVGASSTPQNKTFPTVLIEGYQGRARVRASCVTKDEPYRPHPHKLVGREGCCNGVCSMEVSTETMAAEFTSLGLQCMKRKDIEKSLKMRKDIRVDPFRTGFADSLSNSLDLTAVRLCFQVLLPNEHGEFKIPLTPIVTEPIYHKRVVSDLTIVKLSKCVSPVTGGREEILLVCDKVLKNNIEIRFYQEQGGELLWEGFGIFQPSDVYKQVVIGFRAPPYKILTVTEPVQVFVQLRRPSDGETSASRDFEYLPVETEPGMLKDMRQKFRNLQRNASVPPLPKQERNTFLFPKREETYTSRNPIDMPNNVIPPQRQFSLPTNMMDTTLLVHDLERRLFQLPNRELNESLTSDKSLNKKEYKTTCNWCQSELNLNYDLNSAYTPNVPSSSLQRICSSGTNQNSNDGGSYDLNSAYTTNLPSYALHRPSTSGTNQNPNGAGSYGLNPATNLPSSSLQRPSSTSSTNQNSNGGTNYDLNSTYTPNLPSFTLLQPSTSATTQNLNDGMNYHLKSVCTLDPPSSSPQVYPMSVDLLNSTSPSTNPENNFLFENMENVPSPQNYNIEKVIITKTQNNLGRSNSSDMEIPSFSNNFSRSNSSEMGIPSFSNNLARSNSNKVVIHNFNRSYSIEMDIPISDLLINVNDRQLQQINIDSGELDAMHTST